MSICKLFSLAVLTDSFFPVSLMLAKFFLLLFDKLFEGAGWIATDFIHCFCFHKVVGHLSIALSVSPSQTVRITFFLVPEREESNPVILFNNETENVLLADFHSVFSRWQATKVLAHRILPSMKL